MGLSDDNATKTGQVVGRVAQDIVRDSSRRVWWLLNAPQAVVDIAAEEGIKSKSRFAQRNRCKRRCEGKRFTTIPKTFRAADKVGATKGWCKAKGISFGPAEEFTDQYGNTFGHEKLRESKH